MIDYTLIRSKRKTTAIHIIEGSVEVRAPLNVPKRDIDRFVASKEAWIAGKLSQIDEQKKCRRMLILNYGDSIPLRGIERVIITKDERRISFDGEAFCLPPGFEPDQIKAACIRLYRMMAKKHIADRVAFFAGRMGVVPSSVKVNDARTRWGSCSSKRNLNFSWRLIMAEDDAIDFVVVHELAHLIEMNHSVRFWAIVEDVIPDYRERQVCLKAFQRRLEMEGWD